MSLARWSGGTLVLATLVAAGFTWSVILDNPPAALPQQQIEDAG